MPAIHQKWPLPIQKYAIRAAQFQTPHFPLLPRLLHILFFLPSLIDLTKATIFSNSLQQCHDQCQERNLAFPLPHGHLGWPNISATNCDFDCLIDACRFGCQDLESLSSSCDVRCESIGSGSVACYQGCRAIADIFLHQIQKLIDLTSVEAFSDPALGIGLNWSFPEGQSTELQEISTTNIRWIAQSRAAGKGQGWKWTQMDSKAFKDNSLLSTVFISVNPPYSSDIELRLAAIWRDFVIVSYLFRQTLLVFDSLPMSAHHPRPTEGPILQMSESSFVVCWNIGQERLAASVHETPKFRLRLFSIGENDAGDLLRTEETATNCHLFRNLTFDGKIGNFRIAIGEKNDNGGNDKEEAKEEGISEQELQMNVTLQEIQEPEESSKMQLAFTNGTALFMMENLEDFVMLTEPQRIPFQLNASQSVTAIGSSSIFELLIGLSDGSIFLLNINERLRAAQFQQKGNETSAEDGTNNGMEIGMRLRAPDGVAITQIVIDHLQERFYALREKTGILRCQLKTCENSTTLPLINSFVQQMAVDPWNGYLYYTTSSGDLFSTPLFPLDAPQNYSHSITRRIAELSGTNTLDVDLKEQKLIAITKYGKLMSRDLVDGIVRDERDGWTMNDQYKNVLRSHFHRNRLFWISSGCGDSHPWESCLYSEEFDGQTKTVHLNKYLYPGPVKEFVLLHQFWTPPFMIPPSKVGLLLSETEALSSWKPPISLPFQASGSGWRSLSYKYILQYQSSEADTSSSLDQLNSSTTSSDLSTLSTSTSFSSSTSIISQNSLQQNHLIVQINEPNGEYIAMVKACIGRICSAPIGAKSRPIRADKAGKTISLLIKKQSPSLVESSNSQPLGQLMAMEMLGREMPAERAFLYPQIPTEQNIAIAFDNASNVLFSSSRKDSSIMQRVDSNIVHFLNTAFVHQMALSPSKALLFLATAYSLYAYRSTSSFDKTIYNCATEECGELIAIAADDSAQNVDGHGRLFLLIQLTSGTVQLLQIDIGLDQPVQMVSSVKNFQYKIRQMDYVDERLLILTEDGFFGTLDLDLQNVNFNLATRDIQYLFLGDHIVQDRHIHFEGPIKFDEKSGQLRWNVASVQSQFQSLADGEMPFLFNLDLFKERFGNGEKTTAFSQTNSFLLPPKMIQTWNSKQRFDVQLEAISPWTRVWVNRTGLNAASKPPSAPENVRIFATQQKTIDGTRALIDLFWDEPSEWNGDKFGYQLNCSIQQENNEPAQYANATLKGTQRSFSFAVRSGKIQCLVFAMNDQRLMGPPSNLIEIDGSEFEPLIRLYAIDSTENLVAIQNWTIEAAKVGNSASNKNGNNKARFLAKHKRKRRQIQQSAPFQYQAITFVGNELFAVRKEPEMSSSSQIVLVKLDMNQVNQTLYKASIVGDFAQIDAIAADWVANRLLLIGNRELMQIQLDQLQQDLVTISPKRLLQLSIGAQDAKQLIFDPFTNTAFLLTKNGSLFALDLNKGTETNLELTTACLRQKTITSIVGDFTWNRAGPPQLYALTWNGLMELKLGVDICLDINVKWELFGERGLKAISQFAVADKVFVFATPNELLVYDRSGGTVSQFPIPNPPLKQLLAVSQSAQPFPNRDCFQLPSPAQSTFTVQNEGRTGAIVELPEPKRDPAQMPPECANISQPQIQFEIHFRKKGSDKEKLIHSNSNKTFIDQGVLDKNTDYEVSVGWLNRYWPAQGQSELKLLHTGFGFPSAPKEPNVMALSPDTVLLSWTMPDLLNAPANEIRYRISQQNPALTSPVPVAVRPQQKSGDSDHFTPDLHEAAICEANPCLAKVPNLRPSTDYHFWITALHLSRLNTLDDAEATSMESQAHTRDIPGILRLENVTSNLMNLRWNTLPGAESGFPPIERIQVSVQYRESGGKEVSWLELYNSTFVLEPNASQSQRSLYVDKLNPATTYDYRYAAEYTIVAKNAGEEKEGVGNGQQLQKKELISELFYQQTQQARTKAGTPSAPTNVQLVNEPSDGGWTLRWTAPDSDGGEPILNYAVEYRQNSELEWEIAERGLPADRLYWHVAWAESHARHGKEPSDAELAESQFRVRAANVEGFGDFGYTKVPGEEEKMTKRRGIGIWWYILLASLLALLSFCIGAYGFLRWKLVKRRRIKAELHKPICLVDISKQIQESQQNASMQFSPEVQNELKILPKIAPERVKVTKQLGMGSFGRVCEGFMQLDREVSIRVAIKYLKDNSHENHIKFLKEAILMNNFDHPNIVKLLGVNMIEGEHFLVLELMDGGDMLNFLRASRPRKGRPSRLCLRDLIAMAVDVGRGCIYLETYKHVHRDIAARNCLISSRTSPQRVTKIADFGLARSLFFDDYYRVHGQDMLPLRWLSPEVVTDGLFTSKSDVWAYGVLLWEIITLGEQPYSNKQNPEVLNLISNGICMERPMECPSELFEIMKACWTPNPEKRSRFADIQPKMESIRGLPHFQSREPFPTGLWSMEFDQSQDSGSSTTRESSTTTNGGDSSNSGFHFEKSENSTTKKHHLRLNAAKQQPHQQRQHLGHQSSSFSTMTTSTGLDPSADYELPIRPKVHSLGSRPPAPFPNVSGHLHKQQISQSPRPLLANAQRRNGNGAFQNIAFIGNSPANSTVGTSAEHSPSNNWASQSYQQFPKREEAIEQNSPGQKRFGASSSRVSRV